MVSGNTIETSGEGLTVRLGLADGLQVHDWRYPGDDDPLPVTYPVPIIAVRVNDVVWPSTEFRLQDTTDYTDQWLSLVSAEVAATREQVTIRARVALLIWTERTPEVVVQLAADWETDEQPKIDVSFPLLRELASSGRFRTPGWIVRPDSPEPQMVWVQDDAPPLMLVSRDGESAISFDLPAAFPWHGSSNRQVTRVARTEALADLEVGVRPTSQYADVLHIVTQRSARAWNGVFLTWKDAVRQRYDLRCYRSEGAEWARRSYLHHFTYAYGREIYDYDAHSLNIGRLLDAGEEFGGYDAIIFWHQYPRLGLDARTQWEMYDDLPCGRQDLRRMATACHERGVRLLLPFKPWDVRRSQSLDENALYVRELVAECGVDGFFLDTMSSVPHSFTQLQATEFPRLLFASEGTPREPRQIEQLVSSWDQRSDGDLRVDANLFRFLFPEHALNMISRWSVGSRKDVLIKRAIFNGMGLVIWQDVFGEWLPYSSTQRHLVRCWKAVLATHHDLFFGGRSVPLVDIGSDALMANLFAAPDSNDRVLTLYNATEASFAGPLRVPMLDSVRACKVELSSSGTAEAAYRSERSSLHVTLEAGEVVVLHLAGSP